MINMTKNTSLAAVGLGIGLSLVVACGSAKGHTTVGAGASPTTLPAPSSVYDNPAGTIDLALISINHLVNTSDAAVVATVSDVSAPRWNSDTGAAWTSDPNDANPQKAQPFEYRDVTLKIQEVLFHSSGLNPPVDSTVDVKIYGTGENTGEMISGNSNDRWNQIAGPFTAGGSQLVFLEDVDFPMQSGLVPAIVINHDRYGHWVIVGSTAESMVPGRTVPVQSLKNRITSERSAGLQQQSPEQAAQMETNPLG